MKKTTITPSVEQIINDALAIEAESAQDAGALGFMARAMVQATLPHKKVVGTHFERTNGNYTLTLTFPPKDRPTVWHGSEADAGLVDHGGGEDPKPGAGAG